MVNKNNNLYLKNIHKYCPNSTFVMLYYKDTENYYIL